MCKMNMIAVFVQFICVTCICFSRVCDSASVVSDSRRGVFTPVGSLKFTAHDVGDKLPPDDNRNNLEASHTGLGEIHRDAELSVYAVRKRPCPFEKRCRCYGSVADCSNNHGSLTFIPRLPLKVIFLNFAWNNLTAIANATFFTNATHLTGQDLSNNDLSYIAKDSFQPFVNLTRLVLRVHSLNYDELGPVLSVRTLEYLDISQGPPGPFPDDVFHRHPLPHLKTFCVNDSAIWFVNMSAFQPLVNLTHLHLGGNQISHQFYTAKLANLEVLVLSRNGIFNFPETCSEGKSLFPRLAELYMKNNLLSAISTDVCLPSLRMLVLSSNMFSHLMTDMFNERRFPALFALYLDDMSTQILTIGQFAFRNPSTRNLSLMYNTIDFSIKAVHPDSFKGLTNLSKLQLGHNYVNYVTSDRFLTLFSSLTNLRVICFGLDFIHNITEDMLKPYKFLTHLWFYDNEITSLPDGVFDSLPNLTHVYLGGNRLNTITENTFSQETRNRLVLIDLSGDQFLCTCGLLWFRKWLVNNASQFIPSYYTYHCKNLPGVTVQQFFMDQQACLFTPQTYVFIVITMSVLILSMTLTSGLFRFRWHLRLMLYEAFRGHGDLRRHRLQTARFEYDVFVSYAGNDLPWVRQHLIPELEDKLGLRLCIHQRNFIPGNDIVDNIVESVESSKKIMMIFSDSFVRSQWCQFELALCLRYVMDYDDALVIVCLNDVVSRDMTGAMMAVLKTTSYIQWANQPEAVDSFWGRIAIALNEIIQ